MSPKKPSGERHDAAAALFEDLVSKGHEPLLHATSGTIRIDLTDAAAVEHWYITVARGNVSVSHRNAKADAVMHLDKKLFEGMAKGSVNLTAALLRGVVEIEGDIGLVNAFSRLFPGPAASRASFLERQKELAR
jgi:putative sterol carrier protein